MPFNRRVNVISVFPGLIAFRVSVTSLYTIKVGRGFVENHDRRTLQQDSGNSDALSFAAVEFHALLPAPFGGTFTKYL